jgi:hypothetical protein
LKIGGRNCFRKFFGLAGFLRKTINGT